MDFCLIEVKQNHRKEKKGKLGRTTDFALNSKGLP